MSPSVPLSRGVVGAWLLVLLVLAAGVYLRIQFREPKQRTPDEQFYTAYAIDAARTGPRAVRTDVRLFNESPRMRRYPRPTRVGLYLPAAALMRLTGDHTPRTVALLSTVASLVGLVLALALGARAFGLWPALVALLFLAVSPLDLTMARKAWVDALLGTLTLGMAAAYGRAAAHPERWGAWLLFLVLGTWSLLVKESAVIAFAFGCLGLAVHGARDAGRARGALRPLLGGALAAAVAALALIWLCGGLGPLLRVFQPLPGTPPSTYLADYDSGGPGYYVVGLALLQPVPFVLGVIGALLVALRVKGVADFPASPEGRRLLLGLAWMILGFGAVALVHNPKNLRHLSPILPLLALVAAIVVAALLRAAWHHLPRPGAVAVIALAAAALGWAAFLDLDRFLRYFIVGGVPDLATPWLLQVGR